VRTVTARNHSRRTAPGHVLVVVENLPVGIDIRARKQVVDLVESGYRVSVITQQDEANAPYRVLPGVRLLEYRPVRAPLGLPGYVCEYAVSFLWAAWLAARARRWGPIDVVQFCQPPDIYFPLAGLLRMTGSRVLVDQRDLMPELLTARMKRPPPALLSALAWLERRAQRCADHTVCVNAYLRDRAVASGADRDRVTIVRNGPVLERVQRATPDPRLRSGFAHLCCWVGKMGPQDRVDLLLESISVLVHELGRTDCRFAILGDGECLDDMRSLSVRLGLQRWVEFPGWLPERDVFTYLATADLGLDSSLQSEVSPVKVMEYMAFGVPVVAFDLPETRAIAEGAGHLVFPGGVGQMAAEVATLLESTAEREALGSVGRTRVAAQLSWERQRGKYLEAVARCFATAGSPPAAVGPAHPISESADRDR
jgi:glycosyltransferase involved in cell wall biosynthesis